MAGAGRIARKFGNADLAARLADQATPPVIRAYHGSPYDFDKFDASKIGTGEGAQAYGHGLYFAGNEAVAIDYRDRLKDLAAGPTPTSLVVELQDAIREIHRLAEMRNALPGPVDFHGAKTPVAGEWYAIDKQLDDAHMRHQDIQHRIREATYNPGRMYEVAIDRPESSLLDWDAPISRQPKVVQKVFGDFAMDEPGDGGRIYRDIATRHGEAFDDDMTGVLANLEASKELLAEGIPGIRYFDQGSRRAGEGTRNYVMFPGTEDSIRILRKYAVPGAIGAGAAGGMRDDQ
jgi:hypothetical protein